MSFTCEVTRSGLDIQVLADKMSDEIKNKLVERLADVAYAAAFFQAPWKTGALAGSITKEVSAGEARIRALAPYDIYVQLGTRPHTIKPVRASCLAFVARSGELVFTRLVHHPGTLPNPYMQRAAAENLNKAEEVFKALWEELT
jgi:hypothetical protein